MFIELEKVSGENILISWKEIILVLQTDTGVDLLLTNNDHVKVKCSFEKFRKILLEYELSLDKDSHVIAPDREGGSGGWLMVD